MISRPFETRAVGHDGPLRQGQVIAPSDSDDLGFETRAIYVGASGDLTVSLAQSPDQSVTLKGLLAGVIYPLAVHRVLQTGTTATDLVALA